MIPTPDSGAVLGVVDEALTITYDDGRPPLVADAQCNDLARGQVTPAKSEDLIAVVRAAVTWFDQTVTDPVTSGQPAWVFDALRHGILPDQIERTVLVLLGPYDEIISEHKGQSLHPSWGQGSAKRDVNGRLTLLQVLRRYDEHRQA